MKQISLSRGLSAVVDDQDHARLFPFKWSAKPCQRGLYAVANIKGPDGGWHQQSLHRMIMKPRDGYDVIFLDYDGLNCTRSNMRVVDKTTTRQHHRVRRDSWTGLKGISRDPTTEAWTAQLVVGGQPLLLGPFDTADDAMAAYDRAAKEYFGELAPLHRPDGCHPPADGPVMPPMVPPPDRLRKATRENRRRQVTGPGRPKSTAQGEALQALREASAG